DSRGARRDQPRRRHRLPRRAERAGGAEPGPPRLPPRGRAYRRRGKRRKLDGRRARAARLPRPARGAHAVPPGGASVSVLAQQLLLGLLIGGLYGLPLALHALAVRLWTADERSIPTSYGGAVLSVGELSIPLVRLATLTLALVLIGALQLLLSRWRWGKAIRATAEDWQAALLTGIDIRRAYLLAFALGTALAGAAGTLVTVAYSVSPSIGLEWTLKA